MKKSKRGRCTYCGSVGAIEQDHVPPDCIFSKPQPSNLRTVPACRRCNCTAGLDDEYFRDTMALRAELSDESAANDIRSAFLRSCTRPEAVRYKRTLLARARSVELTTPAGLYVGDAMAVSVDGERIARVAQRTVRGLFFLNNGRRLPLTCPIWGCELSRDVVKDAAAFGAICSLADTIVGGARGEDIGEVFRYRFALIEGDNPDTSNDSWWVLNFFNKVTFTLRTGRFAQADAAGVESREISKL